jgi:hypothetical protein
MAIKGWKSAHSDIAKYRSQKAHENDGAHLVSVKKDGGESGMHDAKTTHKTEEDARKHHAYIRSLNPTRNIRHNLYVGGKFKELLGEDFKLATKEDPNPGKFGKRFQKVPKIVKKIVHRYYFPELNKVKTPLNFHEDAPTNSMGASSSTHGPIQTFDPLLGRRKPLQRFINFWGKKNARRK